MSQSGNHKKDKIQSDQLVRSHTKRNWVPTINRNERREKKYL
jgi:hypothetical protein